MKSDVQQGARPAKDSRTSSIGNGVSTKAASRCFGT